MNFRINKFLTITLILFIISFIVWFLFFRVSGDGEYEIERYNFTLGLLLKNHSLKLPAFEIENENEIEFKFKNYNSLNPKILYLNIMSPDPILFRDLSTIVEIEILDSEGNLAFRTNTPLNSHFTRMVADGRTSWPKEHEHEWRADYSYRGGNISYRGVPFNKEVFPGPQIACNYWAYRNLPKLKWFHAYIVKIKILNHPEKFKKLKGQIGIFSRWK